MSTADDGAACVVSDEDGWEAYPQGWEAGSHGCYPTREEAIETVEAVLAAAKCCVDDSGDCG